MIHYADPHADPSMPAALTDPGTNILIPKPGFSLYKSIAGARGVETRSYSCLVRESVCEREKERVCVSECVSVCVSEYVCVCVSVSVWE